jgi:signal transduction histidine kinase
VALFLNEKPLTQYNNQILVAADTSHERSVQRFNTIQNQLHPLSAVKLDLSYHDVMLWIKLPLEIFKSPQNISYLMVRNPHLNYVGAWLYNGDSLVKSFPLTGDHMQFNSRPTYHPDFLFPLPQEKTKDYSIVLLIDKRNEQVNIPIHALTEVGSLSYNRKKNIIVGLITGLSLFLFLFNLFLYYNMRERLYVFYGLYILAAFIYIFSDYGYLFMFLFPEHPFFADFARPVSISLATPLYMIFVMQLMNVKKNFPAYYKWCNRFLILYLLVFTTSIILIPYAGSLRVALLFLMQLFPNTATFLILMMSVVALRKNIPYASYVIITCILLLLCSFLFMQFISGYLYDTFFTRNLMNIAFAAELSILAFALTSRFKNYKEQLERLLRSTNKQQEQIFKSISDYQEKEAQRYSQLLHDTVGARLSAIRFNLEAFQQEHNTDKATTEIQNTVADISLLADEVRSLSHRLSPLLFQHKGLIESVEQLIQVVNKSGKISIQFESIGAHSSAPYRYELLTFNIIQELIQNIIKHADASEVIIQLIIEKEIISIFVEDNGIGFDQTLINEGLGFTQIKQLVTFVNGNLNINAQKGQGCKVSVEFPVLSDETSNPSPNS